MTTQALILLAMILPLAGAVLIVLSGRWPNVREAVTLATSATLFGTVLSIAPEVLSGGRPTVRILEMMEGLNFFFTVEPLGLLFALVASFLWVVTSIYAIGYMRAHHEENQTRFYAWFAISLACTMGIAFAGNMLTLFVFYEMLTLATFPLVTHHGTDEARKAGRVYLGILIGTSIGFLLFAMVWTWVMTGTLDFTDGGILAGKADGPMIAVLLGLYVFGIGKAALMPFHRWLPAAMVAPTPVSALLHAVAVVKAGVFTVLKVIIYIFGYENLAASMQGDWLAYVAGFTIVAASIIALKQDNLKRRLAYSTISQLSYVVLAAAILSPLSEVGAALHIAAHGFGKITLFFAAGAILVASHKTDVSQMVGIGRRMPWTMAAFAVGSLSMIGLPPTAGFISKWYILHGAYQADHMVAVAVVAASTLLNAAYFLPVVYRAFFLDGEAAVLQQAPAVGAHHHGEHGEAPLPCVIAMMITAGGTIAMFVFPGLPISLAEQLIGAVP